MDDDAVVAASAAERRWLADLVETLDDAQLDTPSLCTEWTVRDVLGHLVAAVAPSGRGFLADLLRARGNPHRANVLAARRVARLPVPDLAAALRAHAGSRFAPPVTGLRGPLTDAVVHAADVAVPLGLPHDPPAATVRLALDFVAHGRPLGFVPRGRLTGLRLVAEDLDWAAGTGAPVRGRGVDLLVAACGRPQVLGALTGDGVTELGRRLV